MHRAQTQLQPSLRELCARHNESAVSRLPVFQVGGNVTNINCSARMNYTAVQCSPGAEETHRFLLDQLVMKICTHERLARSVDQLLRSPSGVTQHVVVPATSRTAQTGLLSSIVNNFENARVSHVATHAPIPASAHTDCTIHAVESILHLIAALQGASVPETLINCSSACFGR
jgi:hypothetical protein